MFLLSVWGTDLAQRLRRRAAKGERLAVSFTWNSTAGSETVSLMRSESRDLRHPTDLAALNTEGDAWRL